jgi:hypothetical protein
MADLGGRRPKKAEASGGKPAEAQACADVSIWTALAGEHGIVSKAESTVKAGARLPGELRFGIESQYGTIENWLSANACATTRAWYRSGLSKVRDRRADPQACLRV